MNILVTGAKGQLGSELRLWAEKAEDNYLFTDKQELDITNPQSVVAYITDNNIDVVVNCAAYTQVDNAENNSREADLINHWAVGYIAAACHETQSSMIHISTDYVFDGKGITPYTETMLTNPVGVYGTTKRAGEQTVINSGCRYLIIRTSWLYSNCGNNFYKTMQRLTAERDNLNVVIDQIGTPTYAADLAVLIGKIITDRNLDKNEIYHFSNEGLCSWYDFAVEIASLCGNKCDITPCLTSQYPTVAQRPTYSVLDKAKVKTDFGITIAHWRDALVRCHMTTK